MSEVVIETIPMWIRIYDIPVGMQSTNFIRTLGAQVGKVLEIGERIRDYRRVRVDFALANALKLEVAVKITGRGIMKFGVKYENLPFFCFHCGHIGHPVIECPEDDGGEKEIRFGKELRTSPLRRNAARVVQVPAAVPPARKGLNFSGHWAAEREGDLGHGIVEIAGRGTQRDCRRG